MIHKSLAIERPDLVAEWHRSKNLPLTPHDVTAGESTRVWWKCPKGSDHVWEATLLGRAVRGKGCPVCANRLVTSKNSLAVRAPKLALEWHPTKNGATMPTNVVPGSGKRVWWRCRLGHEWQASIVQRTKVRTRCPYCVGYRVTPERSLAAVEPALARTWHPTKNRRLKPTDVGSGTAKKVWWLCKRGHEWRAAVNSRARRGTGCPMCAGNIVSPERSLATVAPKVAATWHPTRNGRLQPKDVMPGSDREVWWKCPKGPDHEWKMQIVRRRIYFSCPFCANDRVSCTNSLATVAKPIARDWHPTKNGKLRPTDVVFGSGKIVWWRCQFGHEWSATVISRTRATAAGCPGCRFDYQLQRRRERGKLLPVDRALLALKEEARQSRVKSRVPVPSTAASRPRTSKARRRA